METKGKRSIIEVLTGAKPDEAGKVLFSFLALLFLMIAYYLVKPLRTSQFLKDFTPDMIPQFYLFVPLISLAVTKVFNWFCDRMDKYALIVRVYLLIMACKIAFSWLLPVGGKPATAVFFFFASVYFLLALSTLWACFNDSFSSEQGERCFGFVAMGATIGNITGADISSRLAEGPLRDYPLYASAFCMGLALIFLMLATQARRRQARVPKPVEDVEAMKKEPVKRDFWADVLDLWRIPYVRSIAIMVCFLAVFTTTLDVMSQKVIDKRTSERQYQQSFSGLNAQLNQEQGRPADALNPEGFRFIYGLKSLPKDQVEPALQQFAAAHNLQGEELVKSYADYKKTLEGTVRKLFSDVYKYQGVLGIFLLTVVLRFVFAWLGLKVAVVVMPTVALIAMITFCFPVDLLFVQSLLIISGATNYSFNNASKEILYTATSEETKFKHKPLIEGPFMRLGDQGASLLLLGATSFGPQLGLSEDMADKMVLAFGFVLVLIWWFSIRAAGREYDRKRKER